VFRPDRSPAGTTPSTVIAADWPFADLSYVDVDGRTVNTASYGAGTWQIDATRYDNNGNTTWALTPGNRSQALTPTVDTDPVAASAATTAARADLLATTTVYNPLDSSQVTDTYGPLHPVSLPEGPTDARAHGTIVYDEGADPDAGQFGLVTTTISAARTQDGIDHGSLISHTGYEPINVGDTSGWTLRKPTSETTQMGATPSGSDLVKITRYNSAGQVIETRLPAGQSGGDARSTVTTYYTATGTGSCLSAPQAGLLCSTGPTAQPTTGAPLPVASTTYNLWDQPLVATETAGSTVRTRSATYDLAGRVSSSTLAVTPSAAGGTALPVVTTTYNTTTGLPDTTSAGGKTLSSVFDTLGRPTSYTDSTGNTATTSYDVSGNLTSRGDGKGTTSYTYDSASEHRGLVTSQDVGVGAAPGTFTGIYDPDGNIASETYPNGLTANSRYDNTGGPVELKYSKGTTWMLFTQLPDAQGKIRKQASPGSSQTFSYDAGGRLTDTQDTVPAGGSTMSCTTRQYTLDKNSNRTALTSYPDDGTAPSTGHCSTSTTAVNTTSAYDQADRITNTGYIYDTLGRTTTVPSSDAKGIGSHTATVGNLTAGYYSNDLLASQIQGSTTLSFTLDPAQNRFNSTSDGTTTTTNHYAGSSDSPAWTSSSASVWTRNLTGISGGLAATVDQTGTVILRLKNMHGDVVATCPDDSAATGVTSYSESTEFGAPRTPATAPDNYGWLGSDARNSNDLGGLTLMGLRLYNPASGRFLSTDSIRGGSANSYDYVDADPINGQDLTGTCNQHTSACVLAILQVRSPYPPGFLAFLAGRGTYMIYVNTKAGMRGVLRGPKHDVCTWSPNTGLTWDFRNACDTHDLGYDLLRFFKIGGLARHWVDVELYGDARADCNRRSWFNKRACRATAFIFYDWVNHYSNHEGFKMPK
jgi:RHS repeat-associated protein